MMKKYLFLFTISPVQAFIAQARKAQDLFAGSQLLTDLTRFAIEEFTKEIDNNADIIFPVKWEKKFNAALPNRFLAEIECEPEVVLKIGSDLEKQVKDFFVKIAERVFVKQAKGQSKPAGFDAQIENHLIVHWVFEAYKDRTYHQTYAAIESNLGSIKNIREFNQLPYMEVGRKDSLSGELNALFFNNKTRKAAFADDAIQISAPASLLSPGEGLSAVSLTKRFYKYDKSESFPSTAEIAQLDIKRIIEESGPFKLLKSLLKDDFDYQLLYKDNLNSKYFEKQGIDLPADNKSLLQFHSEILKEVKDKGGKQKKYYAILVFDGDDMGKWLSGKVLGDKQNNDSYLKKYHQRFSELLADFSHSAKSYVDNGSNGKTIYAGGDDFLALLNIDNLFDTVIGLRNLFDVEMSKKLRGEYPEINESLTFSAGLTLAHYQHPLGDVLNNAREREKAAKSVEGKDALAISVLKHSGEKQEMQIKWGEAQVNIKAILNIIDSLKNKDFSPAFIENLNQVFQVFIELKNNELSDNFYDIFKLEAGTFVKRAKMPDVNNENVGELMRELERLYSNLDLKNTLETLNIIDFIYRKA